MSFFKEFRAFAVRGNVVDMAVGIIIGAAFTGVVNSLVNDVLMPPLGVVVGGVDFKDLFLVLRPGTAPGPYASLDAAKAAGAATLNLGLFMNTVFSFVLVAFAVFLLVRTMNRLQAAEAPPAPTARPCPYCATGIPLAATRCPNCTSELKRA
jgi:large conductance mechanosensitive channel